MNVSVSIPSQGARSGTRSRPALPLERWLLRQLLVALGGPPVRVALWDGSAVCTSPAPPVGTVRIGDRDTLYRVLYHPELALGEAYVDGGLEIEGDLVQVLEASFAEPSRSWLARWVRRVPRPRANNLSGSRANIHHHYDLGNDFYRLWLDERMVYTCAYFLTPEATLEAAQVAKLEHVCRKVALRPGERVVEAGCGWGALALYMAQQHGATVRAFNISHEQIAYAREQAARAGLTDRVEFIEDDYRNITGQYDVFMSIGMLEHVGPENYAGLGRVIDRCLPAHGRGLIHTIGRNRPMRTNAWTEKYIFPGACPPSLGQMMAIFEPFGFSVLDVENLRLHYAKTAEHWLARYERAADTVRGMFDERFVRAWRLYLAGTTAAFRAASLQLFQVAFARARHNGIPWTRAHVYA
jgi:cyclopropane-fatty-acyl-phospholipid synthase